MRKSRLCLIAALTAMVLCARPSWAVKGYITDPKEAPVRSSPGSQKKVLAVLPSGTAVEVMKTNEWTRVKFTAPSGESREGWVRTWSLGLRPPVETFTKELESENSSLVEKLADTEKQRVDLSQREKELTDKVKKLESDYEALKSGSVNYVKLKEEFDSTKTNLSTTQESVQALMKENQNLRLSQGIKWFGAGAGVLAFGLYLGWAFGRHQKKRRSNYYL